MVGFVNLKEESDMFKSLNEVQKNNMFGDLNKINTSQNKLEEVDGYYYLVVDKENFLKHLELVDISEIIDICTDYDVESSISNINNLLKSVYGVMEETLEGNDVYLNMSLHIKKSNNSKELPTKEEVKKFVKEYADINYLILSELLILQINIDNMVKSKELLKKSCEMLMINSLTIS